MRCALAGTLLALTLAATAHAAGPPTFGGLYDEDAAALKSEGQVGVELVRRPFQWSLIERKPGRYNFSTYDPYVAAAARAHVSLLPFLIAPPPFHSSRPKHSKSLAMYPPKTNKSYGAFVSAVVHRYGPRGSFWKQNRKLPFFPIRSWQVWNEPNIKNFWRSGPSPRRYTALLKVAYRAIKRADPHAEVVSAGLPNSANLGTPLIKYLNGLYRAGAARWFDTLAIHVYSHDVPGLLRLAEQARLVMNRHHDHAKLWLTEFGWSTAGDASAFRVTEQQQADRISESLSALMAERRALGLRGFVLFKWHDVNPPPGATSDPWPLHAGLIRPDGTGKPGFMAFYELLQDLHGKTPPGGTAKATAVGAQPVPLSPLGFAPVTLNCFFNVPGYCAGRLVLRSAQAVGCRGARLRSGAVVGATGFRMAASPAMAPVHLSATARSIVRCAGKLQVRGQAGSQPPVAFAVRR